MIYIGIDPGLTGAIAVIWPSGLVDIEDMPILEVKKKQILNYPELARLLRNVTSFEWGCMASIELVGAMPGQGVSSMFKFGQCYGAALASLAALEIPYQAITPQVWKKQFRLIGCEKDASRSRALELFPECAELLKLKKHHGRADALLLAEYGRRMFDRQNVAA